MGHDLLVLVIPPALWVWVVLCRLLLHEKFPLQKLDCVLQENESGATYELTKLGGAPATEIMWHLHLNRTATAAAAAEASRQADIAALAAT